MLSHEFSQRQSKPGHAIRRSGTLIGDYDPSTYPQNIVLPIKIIAINWQLKLIAGL
jgi:hypothetical protein